MDTRPIPLHDLTEHAWRTLRDILDRLNEIRDENNTRGDDDGAKGDVRGPWATVDPARAYRVIMLDGQRGTGKTSMMLTLIAEWNRRQARGGPHRQSRDGKLKEAGERFLLEPGDVGVRVLSQLDFDPHPEHLHPYAWLVLAFHRVVDWLDCQRRNRQRDDPTRASLHETWRNLYEQALTGWDAQVQRARMATDIDGFIASSLESHRGWHRLKESWREFVDRLLEELREERQLDPDGLLILPIDDLDLHPTLAGGLLRALRLMHHSRLVFLLTGHHAHLRDVFARELLPLVELGDRAATIAQYKKLASDIIDKSIPVSARYSIRLLTLAQALSFVIKGRDIEPSMQSADAVRKLLTDRNSDTGQLASWIASDSEEHYRYRDAMQIEHHNTEETLIELCLLTSYRDGAPVFYKDALQGATSFRCAVPLEIWLPPPVTMLSQGRIYLRNSLSPWIRGTKAQDITVPTAVFLMEYLAPGRVEGLDVESSEWSSLMVTSWATKYPKLPAYVYWPLATPSNSLAGIESDLKALKYLEDGLSSRFEHQIAHFMAWCLLNLGLTGLTAEQLARVDVWAELNGFESRLQQQTASDALMDVTHWREIYLPILAAPEFGLPVALARELLTRVSGWPTMPERFPELKEKWKAARSEGLAAAFEHASSSPTPTEEQAEQALKWIDDAEEFQEHPWCQFIRSSRMSALAADSQNEAVPLPEPQALTKD